MAARLQTVTGTSGTHTLGSTEHAHRIVNISVNFVDIIGIATRPFPAFWALLWHWLPPSLTAHASLSKAQFDHAAMSEQHNMHMYRVQGLGWVAQRQGRGVELLKAQLNLTCTDLQAMQHCIELDTN